MHTGEMGNSVVKRPLGRPGLRWEGNIKMFLQETELPSFSTEVKNV